MALLTCLFFAGLIYAGHCQPVYGQTTLCETPGIPGSTTVCESTPNFSGLSLGLSSPYGLISPNGLNLPYGLNLPPNLLLTLLQCIGLIPGYGCDGIPNYNPYGQIPWVNPLSPIPPVPTTVCESANIALPFGMSRPLTKPALDASIGLSGLQPNILGLGGIGGLPFGVGGGMPLGMSRGLPMPLMNGLSGLGLGGSLVSGLPAM